MQGDLISRAEAEQILRDYADEVGCNLGQYELANGIIKAACKLRDVPVAYDVAAVVESIERLPQQSFLDVAHIPRTAALNRIKRAGK